MLHKFRRGLKQNALITAIKEVRDFTEQIESEILYKESFMLYYKHTKYEEHCDKAIFTRNFESQKFRAAAECLGNLLGEDFQKLSLPAMKMKTLLLPYKGEELRLQKFADRKLIINGEEDDLKVYILEPDESEKNYSSSILLVV